MCWIQTHFPSQWMPSRGYWGLLAGKGVEKWSDFKKHLNILKRLLSLIWFLVPQHCSIINAPLTSYPWIFPGSPGLRVKWHKLAGRTFCRASLESRALDQHFHTVLHQLCCSEEVCLLLLLRQVHHQLRDKLLDPKVWRAVFTVMGRNEA